MVFTPPSFVPKLPYDPPDSVSIFDFTFGEEYGRPPLADSPAPFVEGLTGKEYSALEVKARVERLAVALAEELEWDPHAGSERNRVAASFTVNTVDTLTIYWAIHQLNGIVSPANAAYSADELAYQLKASGATVLFTCAPLLATALEATKQAGIARNKIYLVDVPGVLLGGLPTPKDFRTIESLIERGKNLRALNVLAWIKGQGARQIAFLCFSSGTSGLPKGVMISHRNVIANILQSACMKNRFLDRTKRERDTGNYEVGLGLLPFSHIYGLVAIAHALAFTGSKCVVLPKFEIKSFLQTLQDYQVETIYVVPPIIITMLKNRTLCDQYRFKDNAIIWTGAAPLGKETGEDVEQRWPTWSVRQGYGMTESCTVVSSTPFDDIDQGSSGCLLPGYEARLVDDNGKDITALDEAGELLVRSPSVTLGYLDNEAATKEAFLEGGWLKSGDKALFHKSSKGNEHLWIVDRMKELIKVKGLQVAPAELEAHLLTHPAVADTAVVGVFDEQAGEVPKAFIVKSSSVGIEESDRKLQRDIKKHVEKHKAQHKWLQGGIEFVDVIPKSPSGKILRRLLRDRGQTQRRRGPRL